MQEARAEIRSHPGLQSERKVTKGSAGAPQDALLRGHACSAAPVRWHVCSRLEAVGTRSCDQRRGSGTCAPPPSSELADVGSARARPSPRGGAEAETGASARGVRALGPERRTCWQTPGAVSALRPECRASECKGGGDSASRGHWRGGGSGGGGNPGAPWPSCCGACRTLSWSPASSAAAGSSRRRMKATVRTARAQRRARCWCPGLDITPPPAARALRGRPMGCGEPRPRR